MKSSEILFGDWERLFIGEVPLVFIVELIIRAICIYIILLIAMRSMGKRMSAQLSRNEMAAQVSLAAAIGVPMMAPDRGILPAVVIAIVIVCVQRFIASVAFQNQRFEGFTQGAISEVLSEGIIDVKQLKQIGLSRERLLAELRANGVAQLGVLKKVYIEANGAFSIIKRPDAQYGLSIIPPIDTDFINEFDIHDSKKVCGNCGFEMPEGTDRPCSHCGRQEWDDAVK